MTVRRVASLGAFTLALAVGGCTVGPDFERPTAPTDSGYTSGQPLVQTASARTRSGAAQHFVAELDIPGDWCDAVMFHSGVTQSPD